MQSRKRRGKIKMYRETMEENIWFLKISSMFVVFLYKVFMDVSIGSLEILTYLIRKNLFFSYDREYSHLQYAFLWNNKLQITKLENDMVGRETFKKLFEKGSISLIGESSISFTWCCQNYPLHLEMALLELKLFS